MARYFVVDAPTKIVKNVMTTDAKRKLAKDEELILLKDEKTILPNTIVNKYWSVDEGEKLTSLTTSQATSLSASLKFYFTYSG